MGGRKRARVCVCVGSVVGCTQRDGRYRYKTRHGRAGRARRRLAGGSRRSGLTDSGATGDQDEDDGDRWGRWDRWGRDARRQIGRYRDKRHLQSACLQLKTRAARLVAMLTAACEMGSFG
jgi:hypothetical protein